MNDTLKMEVKVEGEGKPLLLAPGGLTGWASWEPFVEDFSSKGRKVIRVQLLNVQYGIENRPLPKNYSVKTESRALAASLDSIGYNEPIDIIAWSFGSLTSLDFALDHPNRIRSLVLIEPPAFWVLKAKGLIDEETQKSIDFLETLHGNITKEMLAAFLKEAGILKEEEPPEKLPQWEKWVQYRQSLRNAQSILAHKDDLNRLRNIKSPVLLIKGTGSMKYYHKIIDVLASYLPDARVIELPGAHAAHIISKERFLSEVDKFQKAF